MKLRIKKDDTVQVIVGRDKGKRGKIIEVFPREGKVRVDGVNVQKRHLKAGRSPKTPQGGIIDRPGKINVSNVMLYSEKLGKAVRVGTEMQGPEKVRVARGRGIGGTAID